jgi:hypothetical protein
LYAPAIEPGNFLATSIQVKKFMGSAKEIPAKLKQSSRSVPDLDGVTAASSANRPPQARPINPIRQRATFNPKRFRRKSLVTPLPTFAHAPKINGRLERSRSLSLKLRARTR